nr:PIN domain-containing protein [uncultured Albidiferax sp.]
MVLVDTSVWVNHFRTRDPVLFALLQQGQVCTHAFVLGELALGNLRQTDAAFEALLHLPRLDTALDDEVLTLIDRQHLAGRGIGYVDAHLMTSVFLAPGCRLWSQDKRLQQVAQDLGRAVVAH